MPARPQGVSRIGPLRSVIAHRLRDELRRVNLRKQNGTAELAPATAATFLATNRSIGLATVKYELGSINIGSNRWRARNCRSCEGGAGRASTATSSVPGAGHASS